MFTDNQNKLSMMRVGFFVCLIIGSLLSLGGMIAVFMKLADASVLVMSGTGLMGTSSFAKAVQSKWEKPNV
jgi:hypothetical protein